VRKDAKRVPCEVVSRLLSGFAFVRQVPRQERTLGIGSGGSKGK
jgi:hypothetical protein